MIGVQRGVILLSYLCFRLKIRLIELTELIEFIEFIESTEFFQVFELVQQKINNCNNSITNQTNQNNFITVNFGKEDLSIIDEKIFIDRNHLDELNYGNNFSKKILMT